MPLEFGIKPIEKINIGQEIIKPLLSKIESDLLCYEGKCQDIMFTFEDGKTELFKFDENGYLKEVLNKNNEKTILYFACPYDTFYCG